MYGFVFALGTIAGSFINVVTLRFKTGLGLLGGSFCFSCGKQLGWHELIPIVSFLLQAGRCRYCHSKLSIQYPLVELLTGLVFLLIASKTLTVFGASHILNTLYYILIFSLLLAIAVYDIRHKIIPDSFVYAFVSLSLGLLLFKLWTSDVESLELLAGPILSSPLVLLWLISRGRWMGLGDAKLTLGIGWLLGLSSGFAALVLSFWIGAIVGLGVLLGRYLLRIRSKGLFLKDKNLTMKSEIPFAPFLALGTFLAFFFNLDFVDLQSLFVF